MRGASGPIMTKPWKAEHEVSAAQTRHLIESQFPDLAPARIQPLGVGFDNTAYLVNEQFVFRFPRRQLGADCMEVELAVLPHLVTDLSLPIPDPIFVGQPTDSYPWAFAGYPRLAGRTACAAKLDDGQRTNLGQPLARFLASLHRFSTAQGYAWGAPADTLGRLDAKKRVPMARLYLERLYQLGLLPDIQDLMVVVDDFSEEAKSSSRMTLLHGDLYARHLLVDDSGSLCGVIDWGDIHVGSIAVDLAIAHSFLPPAAHDRFREAYGPISEQDWRKARFRAIYHSAVVAAYGHDVGDEDLVCEGLTSLQYIVS